MEKIKMSNHRFNIQVAQAYGVNEAILLENISFWQAKNEANNHNYHDGRYWVYNSIRAFESLFPYWSKGQITRLLKKLESEEAIISANYNKVSYDRTKWYTLKREIHLLISGNGIVDFDKPIPDNKPDNKPDTQKEFETFWNLYPKKVNKGRAETTFLRVRKQTSLDDLLNGLKTSPQMHREKQYIPNAQAWLNGQGWEDEADTSKMPFPQPHLKKYRLGDEDVYVDIDDCMVYTAQGDEHSIYEYSNGMITS
jgi:hypothetical protein